MSGSRKSLKSLARHFNPRAENDWSKDDSKFGQRMLEKMGWTKGQGVGRDNQGIAENIKLQMKFDNKGLGFKITDADHLLEIESNFAHLLSNLNQNYEEKQVDDSSPEIENLNSPLEDSNERHEIRKTKKRKAKIVEIVEDEDAAAARSAESDVSSESSRVRSTSDGSKLKKMTELHSTNIDPSDCSKIVDLEVTNKDEKRKIKSKSKKEKETDAESAELSSIDVEIAPENTSRKHKHKKKSKKSKNTDDDSECTNGGVGYAINDDEDETRASDLIDTSVRLEAESEIAATPTHYSTKRRKCRHREEHIEPSAEEMDSKRERKRKKCRLDETDSNNVTSEVSAVVDEYSEETESSRRKSKTKRSRKTPDDDTLRRKKCEESKIEPDESLSNGQPFEETFCEQQTSVSSEAIGNCEDSRLSSPSASKTKEKTDVSGSSADKNRQYATEERKLSKAERIIMKARLMKKLRNETIVHDFDGSNISCISGYGNRASVK